MKKEYIESDGESYFNFKFFPFATCVSRLTVCHQSAVRKTVHANATFFVEKFVGMF